VTRVVADPERGVTMFEVLLVASILAFFVIVGFNMSRSAPPAANRTTTLQSLVSILDRTRAQASAAGAILAVSPTTSGSSVIVYSGWSTATQVATYTTAVPLGLHVTAPVDTAGNTFSLYVRRNGSWYAMLGAATIDCASTFLIGVYNGTTVAAADGYPITCSSLSVTPAAPS